MLTKYLLPAAFVGAAALSGGTASAALLDIAVPVLPPVQTEIGTTSAVFDPFLGFIATGLTTFATLEALAEADGTLLSGSFSTLVDGEQFSGFVTEIGFDIDPGTTGGDILQFRVDLTGGPFLDGGLVTYTGEFGTDPAAPFGSAFSRVAADYALQPLGIPLPAGLPLIAGALAALFAVARRRAA